MSVLKDYLIVNEAAVILGIHPGTVKRLCRERKLSGHKVHNGWLIHKDDLRRFAAAYDPRRGKRRRKNDELV